jgi:hypothetical protein
MAAEALNLRDGQQVSGVQGGQSVDINVERYFPRAQVDDILAEFGVPVIPEGADYYTKQLLLANDTTNCFWS